MSDVSDVIERDGVAGRLVYVWAVWSPCDLCWASISVERPLEVGGDGQAPL